MANPTSTPKKEADADTKSVQSLVRGLNVLIAVNEKTPASVSHIVLATGIAKGTVIRLLKTLKNEGYIDFDKLSGGYKVLPKVRLLARPMLSDNNFSLTVQHFLNDFSQIVKWPTDVLMLEGSAMVIQASSRSTAPITLKRFDQVRFELFSSASGIAFLSGMDEKALGAFMLSVTHSQDNDLELESLALVHKRIEQAKLQGYALAEYHAPIEGTRAIAIPLISQGKVFGALAMLHLKDVVTDESLVNLLLPNLKRAANEISKFYEQNASHLNLAPINLSN